MHRRKQTDLLVLAVLILLKHEKGGHLGFLFGNTTVAEKKNYVSSQCAEPRILKGSVRWRVLALAYLRQAKRD